MKKIENINIYLYKNKFIVYFMEDVRKFDAFMSSHQTLDKINHTHTLMTNTGAKYNIPDSDYNKFLNLYKKVIGKKHLHITERQKDRNVCPLFIDIDYNIECKERQYLDRHVTDVIKITNKIIKDIVKKKKFEALVFEKEYPSFNVKKHIYKDGFHIVYPLPLSTEVRFYIYHNLKKEAEKIGLFDDIKMTSHNYSEIFDESVVQRNGWLMYGSCKNIDGMGQTYRLTGIYNHNEIHVGDNEKYDQDELITYTAVRQYGDEDALVPKDEKLLEETNNIYIKKIKNKEKTKKEKNQDFKNIIDINENEDVYSETDSDDEEHRTEEEKILHTMKEKEIQLAKKLVDVLSIKRATVHKDWINVGWALHNIDKSLLSTFKKFSQKVPAKYEEGCCEKVWNNAHDDGFTIASLHWWAKKDNRRGYQKVLRESINKLIKEAETGSHSDVAKVLYEFYKHCYKCISIKRNMWYEFRGHRWMPIEAGYTLANKITDNLTSEFATMASDYYQYAKDNGIEKDLEVKKGQSIKKILDKLKSEDYINSVMSACRKRFIDPYFESKLNENRDLIGFENGVYDLKNGLFRDGLPDDYITMSTGYDYTEFKDNDPSMEFVNKYLSQVQRDPNLREYLMNLCSSYLDGHTFQQKFIIWTGSGCHAPDTEIMMSDGTNKKVQDIQLNEYIMGDDGRPRHVKIVFKGESDMYRIYYGEEKDNTYIDINKQHRLALKCKKNPELYSELNYADEIIYTVKWHEYCEHVPMYSTESFKTKEEAEIYLIEELPKNINYIKMNEIIPVTVNDFISLENRIKDNYVMCDQKQDDKPILKVENLGKGKFFGFELDGNRRYVMGNGLITYNSNGKSTTINLIQYALGEYFDTLPTTVLTMKRAAAGNATPELANKVGKRLLSINEPEQTDTIYVGQMKQLTGTDWVEARALYGNPFRYQPQFKLLLACNRLPSIPANDGGTWRRIRVLPWESEFVEGQPKKPNQFPRDNNLDDKLKKNCNAFMYILLKYYYPNYMKKGYKIHEPDKILEQTKSYQEASDTYKEFINEEFEITEESKDKLSISAIYECFKQWYQKSNSGKAPNKRELIEYLKGINKLKFAPNSGNILGAKFALRDEDE